MNREDFISADAELLEGIEADIYDQLEPLIDSTLARMAALPEDASECRDGNGSGTTERHYCHQPSATRCFCASRTLQRWR